MQVRIEEAYPGDLALGFDFATSARDGRNKREIPAHWQQVEAGNMLATLPGRAGAAVYVGVVHAFDNATLDFNYLIGVLADADTVVPAGCRSVALPAGRYAVLTTTPTSNQGDFVAGIQQGWQWLMAEWLPESGYRAADTPSFERYDEPSAPGQSGRTMAIWMPLQS
ncbi:hypothetical protein IGB42_00304 [Andreprevotia sp. IGB-42]|uniref:GyrI-like domain-containing protein n=1 Tax=Andreprevotia sp. IGB-42 TaxID=2497473 RepID=UPI00135CEA04|nr:GyrI-like domain-containing protein [Andreprevotia sp. IGB-42]KAF0815226.1 hypothetical protein IGB42_00304 [Andreprevotia sp. IGB-42]